MSAPRRASEGDPGTAMRGLGRFFGHVFGAIRRPVEDRERVEVRRESHEHEEDGVTLRRTVIEEIEFRGGDGRREDDA